MASYMVHNSPCLLQAYGERARSMTSQNTRGADQRMASHLSDNFRRAVEVSMSAAGVLPSAARIELSPAAAQTVPRFEYGIPDHMLQAWPLVHKVHSQRPIKPESQPVTGIVLTRRQRRNSQGVYRSSVLTPGEVEFMVRKPEAQHRRTLGQHRVTRSCTEFTDGGRTFVTHDGDDYGGNESPRAQYSRMTTESRVSVIPSTIQVTLPVQQQETPCRVMRSQDPPSRLAETAVADGVDLSSRPISMLLGREKATRTQIQWCGAREQRRREQRREKQQFLLRSTPGVEWYEAQGLQTPTVLQKYLKDSFYINATTPSSRGGKAEVNTTALLNYIWHKQKNTTYNPPPPSSGSGEEKEEEDTDYQEVHFATPGVDGYLPRKGPENALQRVRVVGSRENLIASRAHAPPPQATSLYILDRNRLPEGHVPQDHTPHDRPAGALPRTLRENGCSDLLGGDHVPGNTPGNVTQASLTSDHHWTVNGLSNLQTRNHQPSPHTGNKQHQYQVHLHPVAPSDSVHNLCRESPELKEKRKDEEELLEEQVLEDVVDDMEDVDDKAEDERHLVERPDTTKRITVVLPSSETPDNLEPAE